MKEELLASHELEDGLWLCLWRMTLRAGETDRVHHRLTVGGIVLMESTYSEHSARELAVQGLANVDSPEPKVLIGGLGLCYTLGAALDRLPEAARVTVSEFYPEVLAWNREHLSAGEGRRLDDARVQVDIEDVGVRLRASREEWDAVLLDVDNGVQYFHRKDNDWLYSLEGLAVTRQALRVGGTAAYWAIIPDEAFEKRLLFAGFEVSVRDVTSKLETACVYVARRTR